jgi:hypothetical protein
MDFTKIFDDDYEPEIDNATMSSFFDDFDIFTMTPPQTNVPVPVISTPPVIEEEDRKVAAATRLRNVKRAKKEKKEKVEKYAKSVVSKKKKVDANMPTDGRYHRLGDKKSCLRCKELGLYCNVGRSPCKRCNADNILYCYRPTKVDPRSASAQLYVPNCMNSL